MSRPELQSEATLGARAAAAGLAASGVVHVALVGDHHSEAWWLGAAFLLDGTALLVAAVLLLTLRSAVAWRASGVLCAATIIAYCFSRTVGLPGSHRERWDPLGIVTTAVELVVVRLALDFLPRWRLRRALPAAMAGMLLAGVAYAAAPSPADDPFDRLNPATAQFLRDMVRHGHMTEADALRYERSNR